MSAQPTSVGEAAAEKTRGGKWATPKQTAYLEDLRAEAGEAAKCPSSMTRKEASAEISRRLKAKPTAKKKTAKPRRGPRTGKKSARSKRRSAQEVQNERRDALARHDQRTGGKSAADLIEQRIRESSLKAEHEELSNEEIRRALRRRAAADLPTDAQLHDIKVLARRIGIKPSIVHTRAEAAQEMTRLKGLAA